MRVSALTVCVAVCACAPWAHAQVPAERVLEAWAAASRAVPGAIATWTAPVPLQGENGASHIIEMQVEVRYAWPKGVYRQESVQGIKGMDIKKVRGVQLSLSEIEAIGIDGAHATLRPGSEPEPSNDPGLEHPRRLFTEACELPYLVGCWIADNPGDLVVESAVEGRSIVRLRKPGLRLVLEGNTLDEARVVRMEMLESGEDEASPKIIMAEFSDFRPVQGYPGRLGFRRVLTAGQGETRTVLPVNTLVKAEVYTTLDPAQFTLAAVAKGYVPPMPVVFDEKAPEPGLIVTPGNPAAASAPSNTWRWAVGAAVVALAVGFIAYRRMRSPT